ncbi:MAG TPA: hypothetical protein VGO71_15985 [Baekduia sp.]|jgi:hypothetical protein|nr:hypothetical protein [Baekduia sp.]
MRGGLVTGVVVGLLLVAGAVATPVLMLSVIHGPVTDERLAKSVAGSAGRLSMLPCRDVDRGDTDGRWQCDVWIDEGRFSSGGVDYDVQVRPGSSCWRGRLEPALAAEAHVPARLSGCVRRWQLPF